MRLPFAAIAAAISRHRNDMEDAQMVETIPLDNNDVALELETDGTPQRLTCHPDLGSSELLVFSSPWVDSTPKRDPV